MNDSPQYQVRWSYTSVYEATFGRYFDTLDQALEEVKKAIRVGMLYVDIVHPDGRVEMKKGRKMYEPIEPFMN